MQEQGRDVPLPIKSQSAFGANVLLYIGMYPPLVGHHVAELFEPHRAVGARTSQLTVVTSLDMALQCLFPCVTPRTLSALKRLLDMCLCMKHKTLLVHEFLAASRALEWLDLQVRPHVILKSY